MTINPCKNNYFFRILKRLRSQLLNLTARNKLVKFRHTRHSIRFVNIGIDNAYKELLEGKTLQLKCISNADKKDPVSLENYAAEQGICIDYNLKDSHHIDHLQTLLFSDDLDKTARIIRAENKLSLDETGNHILFLVCGFLQYSYANSTSSQQENDIPTYTAPLLMLPVQLQKGVIDPESGIQTYNLATTDTDIDIDEEIKDNITLKEKLRQEFGFHLPSYQKSQKPSEYLHEVATASKQRKGWEILPHLSLVLLSFKKLALWADLDPEQNDQLTNHPIIKKIFSSESSESINYHENDAVSAEYLIDEHPLVDLPCIYDVDSSQHSALIDALEGKNMVIIGPPGTGKSQTITNLIATAMGKGKTILFVAEKKTALDVVFKKLERAGLGAFCLELHSNKTCKKSVLESIDKRLNTTFIKLRDESENLQKLKELRYRLTTYSKVINDEIAPDTSSIHNLIWESERARQKLESNNKGITEELQTIFWENAMQWGADDLIRYRQLLEDLKLHHSQLNLPNEKKQNHPLSHLDTAALKTHKRKLENDLKTVIATAKSLNDACSIIFGLDKSEIISLNKYILYAEKLKNTPPISKQAASLVNSLGNMALESTSQEIQIALTTILHTSSYLLESIKLLPFSENDFDLTSFTNEHIDDTPISIIYELTQKITTTLESMRFIFSEHSLSSSICLGSLEKLTNQICSNHPSILSLTIEKLCNELNQSRFTELKTLVYEQDELAKHFKLDRLPTTQNLEKYLYSLRKTSWWSNLYPSSRSAKKACSNFLIESVHTSLDHFERLLIWRQRLDKFLNNGQDLGVLFQWWNTALQQATYESSVSGASLLSILDKSYQNLKAISSCNILLTTIPLGDFIQAYRNLIACIKSLDIQQEFFNADTTWLKIKTWLSGQVIELSSIIHKCKAIAPDSLTLRQIRDALIAKEKVTYLINEIQSNKLFSCFEFSDNKLDIRQLNLYKEALSWLLAIKQLHISPLLENKALLNPSEIDILCDQLQKIITYAKKLEDYSNLIEHCGIKSLVFQSRDQDDGISIEQLRLNINHLEEILLRIEDFEAWRNYQNCRHNGKTYGINKIIDLFESGQLDICQLIEAFNFVYYQSCLHQMNKLFPDLTSSVGPILNHARQKFSELDQKIIQSNGSRLAKDISLRLVPEGRRAAKASEQTDLMLLKHEIGKTRRHLAIRKLMSQAGNAIQALKPCFLMSPLSVAQFLPKKTLSFDILVIDEASQMRIPEALASILRSKQIVVVGDPKQLPPSDFFEQTNSEDCDEDEEESAVEDGAQNILERCLQVFDKPRQLRWHYRSQHHNLIAFSNHHFYDERLIVLPACNQGHSTEMGVRYNYVENAIYVNRTNRIEAEEVVAALVNQLLKNPNTSVGVATLNQPQKELIFDLFQQRLREVPNLQEIVEQLEVRDQSVFIKNLENVQGDERDVIFISTVYGKQPGHSIVRQTFGPINNASGWRRLNVLFTRAKQRIELYTSMKPEDVQPDKNSSKGHWILKYYLEFAKSGLLQRHDSQGEPENPFEESIVNLLQNNGYEVLSQVGVKGYWIDIVVLNPENPGEYLAAIECDGATYHSSRSARDRDRIRQELLESMGWKGKIYRIWSTDWFTNPVKQIEHLLNFLSNLRFPNPPTS